MLEWTKAALDDLNAWHEILIAAAINGSLDRQLQEQINETLGMRAIADVIITDLNLQRNPDAHTPITKTADSPPWVEEPSG